ncbi:MAG: hypothetical protein ACXWQE_00035 [Bdellovibrionales bacterium]
MSQHDMVIANQSGAAFRADLNLALLALVGNSSGSAEPTSTFAYMLWIDTSGANPILKIRNAANSAWVTIGRTDLTNFGLLSLAAGGTLAAAISFSNTDYIAIPVGTTAQRPGSPTNGMIRYNTTLTSFEGYNGTLWAPIGGGGYAVTTSIESITASASISSSITDPRQLRPVVGSSAAQIASLTPFGTGGNWKDGTEILLIGTDDALTVTLTYNDAANGLVGNFTTIELSAYTSVVCVYNAGLARWIAQV